MWPILFPAKKNICLDSAFWKLFIQRISFDPWKKHPTHLFGTETKLSIISVFSIRFYSSEQKPRKRWKPLILWKLWIFFLRFSETLPIFARTKICNTQQGPNKLIFMNCYPHLTFIIFSKRNLCSNSTFWNFVI